VLRKFYVGYLWKLYTICFITRVVDHKHIKVTFWLLIVLRGYAELSTGRMDPRVGSGLILSDCEDCVLDSV